jgi:hypothetical protein
VLEYLLLILFGSVLSAILYRMGGAGKYGQWYAPILNTKWRDFGCPAVALTIIGLTYSWHWTMILSFPLMFGALTTYWKKSVTAKDKHWIYHGLGVSIALLPTAIHEGFWIGFLLRCLILPVSMMLVTKYLSNPVREELGRGAVIVLTLPLLLIK